METLNDITPPKESIKLIKNSRGYSWEIKVFRNEDETDDEYLSRLSKIDTKLFNRYGVFEKEA